MKLTKERASKKSAQVICSPSLVLFFREGERKHVGGNATPISVHGEELNILNFSIQTQQRAPGAFSLRKAV